MYTNIELMKALESVEESLGHEPRANDIRRESNAPHLSVYYERFEHSWSVVIEAYQEWKETGEVVEESKKDWGAFIQQQRNGTESSST